MNSSQFMDKQIMDLSASGGGGGGGGGELFDLMNPQGENHGNDGGGVLKKEEILPSYDFHPMRTVGSSSVPSSSAPNNSGSTNLDAAASSRNSWDPSDSKIPASPTNLRYSNILEPREQVSHDKDKDSYDVATVTEIDRTVKKYADHLLHTLEGVSARLSQLESRTHHLEGSVDELKVTVGNNSGSSGGKLRQLENILREVQTGVQVLRDKQEIAEAQLELTKLQQSSSKADDYQPPPKEPSNTDTGPDFREQHQTPPPVAHPQPPLPTPLPSLPQQNQYPPQLQQTQLPSLPLLPRGPSYFPPQGSHPPPQHYQPPPQYYQPMPPIQSQPPLAHHTEESAPYMPPQPQQTYPPNVHQPAPQTHPPPTGGPQYYGPSSTQLSMSSGYGPGISDAYPYSGPPSHYNASTMKPSPFSNSRLPTAKMLPQAMPDGSSSGGSGGNRMPVDDVVDKVVTMGFSREQARATVRKLTESGQPVDLNVVLDKLMNGGGEMVQPQKGWFGQ